MARLRRRDGRTSFSTRRVEAYTDGVFAIAATLLVLDLSVDKFSDRIETSQDLWHALGSMQDNIISFVISFWILGQLWLIHIRQFENVKKTDTAMTWLGIARLGGVVLIPFTTSLNADYIDTAVGRVILPLNFLFVILLGSAQWLYATRSGRGFVEGLSERSMRASRRHSYVIVGYAAIAVVLSVPFGPWAFLVFFFDPLVERLLDRRGRSKTTQPPAENTGSA